MKEMKYSSRNFVPFICKFYVMKLLLLTNNVRVYRAIQLLLQRSSLLSSDPQFFSLRKGTVFHFDIADTIATMIGKDYLKNLVLKYDDPMKTSFNHYFENLARNISIHPKCNNYHFKLFLVDTTLKISLVPDNKNVYWLYSLIRKTDKSIIHNAASYIYISDIMVILYYQIMTVPNTLWFDPRLVIPSMLSSVRRLIDIGYISMFIFGVSSNIIAAIFSKHLTRTTNISVIFLSLAVVDTLALLANLLPRYLENALINRGILTHAAKNYRGYEVENLYPYFMIYHDDLILLHVPVFP